MRLSHSAYSEYSDCAKSYELKYIQRYEEKTLSSALFFGTAFGDTVQMMILDKKDNLTDEEKAILGSCPRKFFENIISHVKINGEPVKVPKSSKIRYFKGDWEPEVLEEEDISKIKEYREKLGIQDFVTMEVLRNQMKDNNLDDDEISLMNYAYWLSIRRKGFMMIEEYADKVIPRIKKVYEIEGKINLKNSAGDEIVGFLDLLCDFECDDGEIRRILFDNKTASSKYPRNSIVKKGQLLLYNYDREVDLLGYLVAVKKLKIPKIGKRKGEKYFEIQILIGETDHEEEEILIQKYDQTLQNINEGHFPKADKSVCKRRFGKPCIYYKVCYENDYSGLFKKPERIGK